MGQRTISTSLGPNTRSCVDVKRASEHGITAHGLLLCRLVLNDIPVFDKYPILETNDIGGDPVHRQAKTGETSMDNHEVSPGEDHSRLILQRRRKALDEIKESSAARFDVRTVLDVVWRPESFCDRIIALVEERVECFHDEGLVLFGCSLRHLESFPSLGVLTELATERAGSQVIASSRRRPEYSHL